MVFWHQLGTKACTIPHLRGNKYPLLQLHGFPLEMQIGNDTPTLNTAHLAGLVFLFRDAVGDHAVMCTDAGRAHWESL